jgi:hypothetical protein
MKADGMDADAHRGGCCFVLMAVGQQLQQTNFLGR